jgi:hypothetical protein
VRRGARGRALLWGDAIAVGEVCMIDDDGRIVLRLTPLVRAQRPVPHADLELFVIWRADKGAARLAAGPWGYERDDEEAGSLLAALGTTDTDTAYDAARQTSRRTLGWPRSRRRPTPPASSGARPRSTPWPTGWCGRRWSPSSAAPASASRRSSTPA